VSERTLPARLIDARRPRTQIVWLPMVPFWLAVPLSFVVGLPVGAAVAAVLGLGLLLAPRIHALLERRARALTIRPGFVRIGRGFASRMLSARTVVGASTARIEEGIAITIQKKDGEPISLVVADETTAHDVLAALGVGHTGSGSLRWLLLSKHYRRLVAACDAILLLTWIFLLGFPSTGGALALLGLIMPALLAVLARSNSLSPSANTASLTRKRPSGPLARRASAAARSPAESA